MKRIVFTLAVVFTVGILFTSCKTAEKKEHDNEHVHVEKTVYQCPMECEEEKTYEKQGKCPVCKMKLRKKVEEKHESAHH